MLKRLAILGLLVFGLVDWAGSQVPRDGSQQEKNDQEKQKSVKTSQPPVPVVQAKSGPANQEQRLEKPSQYPWRELYAPANVPNWVLALLAGVAGWLAYITLRAIKRQAGHMERQTKILEDSVAVAQRAADAAKISADIAARMSVPTLVIHEFGVGDVGAAGVEAFFQCPKIKITVKNYGQTPAILKWFCTCCTCEELPDVPVYEGPGCGIVLEKVVVQPGAEYTLPNLMYLQGEEFSPEDVRAIINREKLFCAYGYICYGDILGNPLRRLKFCETVLNIFGDDETICDWHGEIGPAAYTGTDHFPAREPKQQESNPN